MGTDIWLVRWEYLYGHLSSEEVDFISGQFAEVDSGGYSVDEDDLKEISREDRKKFKPLIAALRKAIKKEGGPITVDLG